MTGDLRSDAIVDDDKYSIALLRFCAVARMHIRAIRGLHNNARAHSRKSAPAHFLKTALGGLNESRSIDLHELFFAQVHFHPNPYLRL
jgi:hypothetical protein